VREALKTLPEKERALMELYYFGEQEPRGGRRRPRAVEVLGLPPARARRRPAAAALGDD
jgi:hypothetical protein